MWFSLASFGIKRFPSILGNYGKSSLRQQSSGTSPPRVYKTWTNGEDQKLKELCLQGFTVHQIGAELNRSYSSISDRIGRLKREDITHTKEKNKVNSWTTEEDALLSEKYQQGLSRKQISQLFPERTYNAVSIRFTRLMGRQRAAQKPKHSDEFVQRLIDLRLKGGKTYAELAVDLNCSQRTLEELWTKHCVSKLSTEEQESIRLQYKWTPQEMKHLLELHHRGMMIRDVTLQFPSKSASAIVNKINREGLRFPGRNIKKRSIAAFKFARPSATSGKDGAESEDQG